MSGAQTVEASRAIALQALGERDKKADEIIKTYSLVAMGFGLIPTPLVDFAAVLALELKMIQELAENCEFTFPRRQVFFKMVISLAGVIAPLYFVQRYKNLIKAVPGIGHAMTVALVLTNGASVYAVGKVFQKHFESGGTFLSCDETLIREYFAKKYEEGKRRLPRWTAAK